MPDLALSSRNVWRLHARSLARALRSLRGDRAEGLHDFRVTLRRIQATARALGPKGVARRSKDLVRSLSERRQLEVDRKLLTRIAELGFLAPEVGTALEAQWEDLFRSGEREAARVSSGKPIRKLEKELRRLARSGGSRPMGGLQEASELAERAFVSPVKALGDRELHRYRLAVKRARYLLEDLRAVGVAGLDAEIERKKGLQDAIGRWNDLRLFRERLVKTRKKAENRGAVAIAAELDRVVAALDGALASARSEATKAIRAAAKIVPLVSRTA